MRVDADVLDAFKATYSATSLLYTLPVYVSLHF
jgi:hypothetical protein